MKKIYSLFILLACSLYGFSQDTLSYWDFNSSSSSATVGSGTISTIGGTVNNGFFTGSTNDPAPTDKAYSTNNYPASNTNPQTAGVQINVSTVGFENINLSYDIRFSGTAADTWVLQYTDDVSATTPTWINVDTFTYSASSSWNVETFDFSSVSTLNDNADVAFRIVSAFNISMGDYDPVSSSSYGTGGTARFDLVTITGDQAVPYEVEFQENSMTVLENSGTYQVVAEIKTQGNSNSSIDLLVSPLSNANSSDYTLVNATATIPTSKLVGDTVLFTFTITDDALVESDEYIICRFDNGNKTIFDNDEQHTIYIRDNEGSIPVASNKLKLNLVTSFSNGNNNDNSAEIVAYDSASQRLFIANSVASRIDIISLANPNTPIWVDSIDVSGYGNINSVAVKNSIVACAMENSINPQANGSVAFFDTNGTYINAVTVGALPDMCAFTHDGNKILVANEGEPDDTYTVDPDGSISVIDISGGVASLTNSDVIAITFTSLNGFENTLRALGVRIYGPSANAAQDLEPEYITISDDDTKAWVSLQENNAIAEINLVSNTIGNIYGLGYKNHNLMQNSLDATNETDSVNFSTYPVFGMYQPDAIAYYNDGTNMYILSANEGDSRDYSGFSEEERVDDLTLDINDFPQREELQNKHVLGRLKTTSALGDFDNDSEHDSIFCYGARSFSIWNTTSFAQTYDSKNELELITATDSVTKSFFNASNGSSAGFKSRSDDKGPEPEGIIVETINNKPYAFIGLERVGGVMVYDITNPTAPQYVTYENNRAQDQGAEGLIFIPYTQAADSNNYLIVANENSSTITIYRVEEDCNTFQLTNATTGNDTTLPGSASNMQDQVANTSANYYTASCGLIAKLSNNASALGETSVRVYTDTAISIHNNQPFVARWYQITPTNNSAADVSLYFTQDDFDNYNTYATANNWPLLPTGPADVAGINNLRITKSDNAGPGNNNLVITPTASWNMTENMWELSFTTPSFSQFRVHAANAGNTPLPVSYLPLEGKTTSTSNQLSWTTLQEINNNYFTVQHSTDGVSFTNLDDVNSKALNGNSNEKIDYEYTHHTPTIGDNYYRLEQVDYDGSKNYSNVIKLVYENNGLVTVYPSPVNNRLNISIQSNKTEKVTINMFDLSGRLILSQENIIDKNNSLVRLDVQALAEGVYNLNIRTLDKVLTTQKIMKQ